MATQEASKPIRYYLKARKQNDPKNPKDKSKQRTVYQAIPTARGRIDFRDFCARVARSTTFNQQEVEAVINYATEIARELVANGDIVQFGDLGTLTPTFVSKVAPTEEAFNAALNITQPKVRFAPSRKFFDLRAYPGVHFDRVEAPTSKPKAKKPVTPASGSTPAPGGTGNPSGDGHLGI